MEGCRQLFSYSIHFPTVRQEVSQSCDISKQDFYDIRCEYDMPDEAFMALELRKVALEGRRGTVKFQPEFSEG